MGNIVNFPSNKKIDRDFSKKYFFRNGNLNAKALCKNPQRDEFWDDELDCFHNFVRMIEYLTNNFYEDSIEGGGICKGLKRPNWSDLSTIDVCQWNYLATGMIMEASVFDKEFYQFVAGGEDGPFHLMTCCLRGRDGGFICEG